MMKKVSPKPLSFKLVTIEVLESILNQPLIPITGANIFQYDISLEQRISAGEGVIMAICSINILNDARDQQLSRIKSSCIFSVSNLDSYTDKKSKIVIVPEDFRVKLNSIAISTTRGIMFSFLKGTYLHNAILPIVDVHSFKLNQPQ
jgi:hypothetical protein